MASEPTLDQQRHLEAVQWGLRLFFGVELIPIIVLFTLRYELDGYYVAPTVNQWMGAAEALIMLLSMWFMWDGLKAIRNDQLFVAQHRLKSGVVLGLAYLALLIYEWSQRFVPVGTRFGENFYSTLGVTAFYTLAGLFVLIATTIKSGRVHMGKDNYWDVQAVTWYWVYQGFIALAVYIYFYWI